MVQVPSPKYFFPGADGDNAAAPVMVTGAEKGIEIVLATVAWSVLQSVAENPPPLFQRLIGEMQFLAVTRFWPVNLSNRAVTPGIKVSQAKAMKYRGAFSDGETKRCG